MSASHANGPDPDSADPPSPHQRGSDGRGAASGATDAIVGGAASQGEAEPMDASVHWEDELKREIQRLRLEVSELRESKSQLLSKLRDAERRRSRDQEELLASSGSSLGAMEPASAAPKKGDAGGETSDRALPAAQGGLGRSPGQKGKRVHPKGAREPAVASIITVDRTLAGVAAIVLGIAVGLSGGALMGGPSDQGSGVPSGVPSGIGSGQVAAAAPTVSGQDAVARGPASTAQRKLPSGLPFDPLGEGSQGPGEGTEPSAPGGAHAIPAAGAVKGSAMAASASLDGPKTAVDPQAAVDPQTAAEGDDEDPRHGDGEQARSGVPLDRVWELPLHLADLTPEAYRIRRGAQTAPCAFAEGLADPERRDELLSALGPCIGAHGEDGVPTGTHRVGGVNCCAHHAFVERMTRASRDESALRGIVEEASIAREDGQVPPLLRLRAERSALHFLRRLAGRWASAGIDDGSMGHRWTVPGSDPSRVQLTSWIRLDESGEPYRFELEIELLDGARGDALRDFRWLGANPLGVRIESSADGKSRGTGDR